MNHYKEAYESLQNMYSQKKGSVICCCDTKANMLGISSISLGTNPAHDSRLG